MQTPEENEVTEEIANNPEYRVLQSTIREVRSVIYVIRSGMDDELFQLETIKTIIQVLSGKIKKIHESDVVDLVELKKLKHEKARYLATARKKIQIFKSLNHYLDSRIETLSELQAKRRKLIKSLHPAEVISIKRKSDE